MQNIGLILNKANLQVEGVGLHTIRWVSQDLAESTAVPL